MAYVQKTKWNKLQEPDQMDGGGQKLSGGETGAGGGIAPLPGIEPTKQKKAQMPGFVDYNARVAANKDVIGRGQEAILGGVRGAQAGAEKSGADVMSKYSAFYTPPKGPEVIPTVGRYSPYTMVTDAPTAEKKAIGGGYYGDSRDSYKMTPDQYRREVERLGLKPNISGGMTATDPYATKGTDEYNKAKEILGAKFDPSLETYGMQSQTLMNDPEYKKAYETFLKDTDRAHQYTMGLQNAGGIEALGEQLLRAPLTAEDAALMQSGNVLGKEYEALTEEKPWEGSGERPWGVAPQRESKVSKLVESLLKQSKAEGKTEREALEAEQARLKPMVETWETTEATNKAKAGQDQIRKSFDEMIGSAFDTEVKSRDKINIDDFRSSPSAYSKLFEGTAPQRGNVARSNASREQLKKDLIKNFKWDVFNGLDSATQGEVMTQLSSYLDKLKSEAAAGMNTSWQRHADEMHGYLKSVGVL